MTAIQMDPEDPEDQVAARQPAPEETEGRAAPMEPTLVRAVLRRLAAAAVQADCPVVAVIRAGQVAMVIPVRMARMAASAHRFRRTVRLSEQTGRRASEVPAAPVLMGKAAAVVEVAAARVVSSAMMVRAMAVAEVAVPAWPVAVETEGPADLVPLQSC